MPEVFFYSKENCQKCSLVKGMLESHQIQYKTCSIEDPDCLCSLLEKDVDISTAPVLQIGDKFITYKDGFLKTIKELKNEEKTEEKE